MWPLQASADSPQVAHRPLPPRLVAPRRGSRSASTTSDTHGHARGTPWSCRGKMSTYPNKSSLFRFDIDTRVGRADTCPCRLLNTDRVRTLEQGRSSENRSVSGGQGPAIASHFFECAALPPCQLGGSTTLRGVQTDARVQTAARLGRAFLDPA